MTRRSHCRCAILAMLGLLFAQFSLMSYACPMQGNGAGVVVAASADPVDCADMARARADANLCELHCQDLGKTAAGTPGDEASSPMLAFAIAPAVVAPSNSPLVRGPDAPFVMATAPPLAVRFCRFQI